MCLRYAFTTTNFKALSERFKLKNVPAIKSRYNIAPTQNVPVIFNDNTQILDEAKWGIPARWHEESGAAHLLFNARAESIDEKPSFKKDFEFRRCLMLADSFYEWKHPEKRPFRISLKGNEPFAFAGIYAEEKDARSVCMITTRSNPLIAKIHDRMPVILPKGKEKDWLEMDLISAKEMLEPYPSEEIEMLELTNKINSSRNDSPDLIEPKTNKGTLNDYLKSFV